MNNKNYCVIMAGGIGSRFWPMSRTSFPKQFHDILGVGRTLIQMTYDRFLPICPKENILVVTNERYKHLVLEQLPDLKPEQVLCEPNMRNTAPCVAYSAFWIAEREPDANIIVAPSDHLILKNEEFLETIRISIQEAQESKNLVTLGIKPTRPDTGYGYIQWADRKESSHESVKRVKTFTEKPSQFICPKCTAHLLKDRACMEHRRRELSLNAFIRRVKIYPSTMELWKKPVT